MTIPCVTSTPYLPRAVCRHRCASHRVQPFRAGGEIHFGDIEHESPHDRYTNAPALRRATTPLTTTPTTLTSTTEHRVTTTEISLCAPEVNGTRQRETVRRSRWSELPGTDSTPHQRRRRVSDAPAMIGGATEDAHDATRFEGRNDASAAATSMRGRRRHTSKSSRRKATGKTRRVACVIGTNANMQHACSLSHAPIARVSACALTSSHALVASCAMRA